MREESGREESERAGSEQAAEGERERETSEGGRGGEDPRRWAVKTRRNIEVKMPMKVAKICGIYIYIYMRCIYVYRDVCMSI